MICMELYGFYVYDMFIPKEFALNTIDSILCRGGEMGQFPGHFIWFICIKDGTHGSHGKMGINNYDKRVDDLQGNIWVLH